jgi:hypothetical protein
MSNEVIVHKGRTNVLEVRLGIDISADTFTSEIRTQPDQGSTLIASWTVTFSTDGTDGNLKLVLDDAITSTIDENSGYMDLKRVSGGEPIPVFDKPLEVVFRGTVTA